MSRIAQEKKVVATMIAVYCQHREGNPKGNLCPSCRALLAYAHRQLNRCPFGEQKTFCSGCKIHCYQPEMRQKIKAVMRYAGPRMLLYHPLIALRHLGTSLSLRARLLAKK